ncbi:MAG: hypothetical protein M1839_001744 [Geoglossum umbratile]|nr:MAG: hypothetical protein M1839_001744 [Geoglossum umbratile]
MSSARSPPRAPSEADLVKLVNIITGRDRIPGQSLPAAHIIVEQLKPFSKWLYHHLQYNLQLQSQRLDAVEWFQKIVHYFSDYPDARISTFVQAEQSSLPEGLGPGFMRQYTLECLSFWLTIDRLQRALDDVQETQFVIKNCVADLQPRSEGNIRAGDVSVKELVYNGRLVLHAGTYTDPLKRIHGAALNVHKLVKFGRLKVKWTSDISQHMVIVEAEKELLLFYLPCLLTVQDAFSSSKPIQAFRHYVPEQLTGEIRRSYWLLFGSSRRGRKSFRRALKADREVKPVDEDVLHNLCVHNNELDTVWSRDKFGYLWPRILELKSHLDSSEPESWWGLIWHDKSQPYVFVPAIISGMLFILALASTAATIAQTWKTFQVSATPGPAPTSR